MGITYAASDENSTLAQRLASSGSTLSVTDEGATAVWRAAFDPAVIADHAVLLQVKELKTTLTYTAKGQVQPVANWQDEEGWQTIGIATLVEGVATFAIERPLGVEHEYRAVVNPGPGELTTDTVTYAAPRQRVDDGLPTVYVDTHDGSKIDGEDAAWEGRVSVTGAKGSRCDSVGSLLTRVKGGATGRGRPRRWASPSSWMSPRRCVGCRRARTGPCLRTPSTVRCCATAWPCTSGRV